MILELENWYLGYQQILTDCRPDDDGVGGSVLLLCSADVDAMAGARIWTYMLRSDGVSYQLLPCTSSRQLEQALETKKADDVRAVVLLNVGATKNLTKLFGLSLDASVKIYVLDCRRPVHLANVHAGNNIVVFWDAVQNNDVPSDGDNLSGNGSSSEDEEDSDGEDDDDDSDDEGENEFDEGDDDAGEAEFEAAEANPQDEPLAGGGGAADEESDYDGEDESDTDSPKKKRKVSKADSTDSKDDDSAQAAAADAVNSDDDESVNGNNDMTASTAPSTQLASQHPTMTPRELHQNRRNRLRVYYNETFYGSPAAYIAYRVATQIRFGDIGDLLWFACVGVTDAYLHSRLDVNGYAVLAMDLSNQCNRLFPNDRFHQQIANTVYAEHLTGAATDSSDTLTKISFSENGRILSEPDFRFFLLRHSSLYDAMVYSDFISTRFQLSTSQGMHKLHEFLAKMGYPLDECQQPFAFMKPKLRRRLQSQINAHAEAYGLENFEFTSFFRVTGYQSLLSASDTSYAVTALLEFEKTVPGSKNRSPEEEEEAESLQAFNLAFDALSKSEAAAVTLTALSGEGSNLLGLVNGGSLSGTVGLGAGIRLAMTMQRTIMATAASLIERNAITRLSHFRYAYLTCTSQSENQGPGGNDLISSHQSNGPSEEEKRHIFTKPLALTRLAHYLMDIHRENGKWTGAKARPLILMAEKPRTNTYLVVGYVYMETASSFVKNPFGKHFALVAQSMQGTFKFESFDSNIVEVSAADVQRFVEQLHYMMDSL